MKPLKCVSSSNFTCSHRPVNAERHLLEIAWSKTLFRAMSARRGCSGIYSVVSFVISRDGGDCNRNTHFIYLKYILLLLLVVVNVIMRTLTLPRCCRLNSDDKLEDEQVCHGATHTDSQVYVPLHLFKTITGIFLWS